VQLQTVIGSGKFSTVWKAIHLPTGTAVAVKKVQIYEIMDTKQRTDCINEVKLLQAAANHPNIITYRDSFIENNELVITLDFCDCGDLGKLVKERSDVATPLTEGDLWSIFSQLCGAVSHMHSHRIMHRDIKPSNVFLSADGVVKLGDLGLSRYFSSKTAQAQSMVGTPYYMSPECIRGQPYEWSSDTWSLGCLLYELGALRNPFFRTGLNYYTLGKLITSCEYDPLPAHSSPEIKQLVAAMLQGDASKRPSLHDVGQFAERCRIKYRDVQY
jgi:serine/threonine protein kinase